jgi:hypothetical protein
MFQKMGQACLPGTLFGGSGVDVDDTSNLGCSGSGQKENVHAIVQCPVDKALTQFHGRTGVVSGKKPRH